MDYITFSESIQAKIKQIEAEYKEIYQTYTPSIEELKFKAFLDDIWNPRYSSNDFSRKLFEYGIIQIFFHYSKDTSIHFSRSFALRKLRPKRSFIAPLWYMLYRLSQEIPDCNLYLCPNILYHNDAAPSEKSVIASNCYFIDIDNAATKKPVYNLSQESIKKFLKRNFPIYSELKPKYILMSGRGLHLYFILEHTEMLANGANPKSIKKVHKWITSDLIELYGADRACKNLNRLMRIPYSTNRKVNLQTKLYITDDKGNHSLGELIDIIKRYKKRPYDSDNQYQFADTPPSQQEINAVITETESQADSIPSKDAQKQKSNNHCITSLCNIRKNDLEKWFMNHLEDLEGRRHTFFWIYINNLKNMRTYKGIIYREAHSLNNQLISPLSREELNAIIDSGKKVYRLTNESIAELLLMTEKETHELKSIYTDAEREYRLEIKKEEKAKRRKERLEQNKENRYKNWEKYFDYIRAHPESTYKVMAADLGISRSYACLLRKEYRKRYPEAS